MRKFGLLLAAGTLVLQASAANADVFSWSYTDGGSNTGSGTLTATPTANPEQYLITAITGTANGFAINAPDFYGFGDQMIYWSPTSPVHFDIGNQYYHADFQGFGFIGPDGKAFNIYEDAFGNNPYPGFPCGAAYCLLGPGASNTDGLGPPADTIAELTDFAVDLVSRSTTAVVPEPMTLSLFGAGFAGMVALRRRRKAKSA